MNWAKQSVIFLLIINNFRSGQLEVDERDNYPAFLCAILNETYLCGNVVTYQ